ncbi:helix-turn-helix domain-containing protein [Paracidovorax cattleyae]|uniref:helix-turn-helix domain-containing protein n=1 Tax=Paracidovorax cattleyae TaxID=80868 RepID=UPI0018B013FE|nr:helix-turn-helix domain-containing protein [Paracidovorax cattleyae]MBF9263374.1 helix-turn-helix domain-containing protein [Paracidovorax cattleyae]
MHPEQIKAEIRMRETTPAAIADELGVSRSMVSHVINGVAKSARIAEHIAKLVGKSTSQLWPEQTKSIRRMKVNARKGAAS